MMETPKHSPERYLKGPVHIGKCAVELAVLYVKEKLREIDENLADLDDDH